MDEPEHKVRVVACCWRISSGRKTAHAVELLPGLKPEIHRPMYYLGVSP